MKAPNRVDPERQERRTQPPERQRGRLAPLVGGQGNALIRERSVVQLIEYVHDPYPFST
ncbi:hypothetical protein [Streptomyces sp. NPDC056069]|uniref:hypothetical protein n=1 Tax=Streptomyces sp. NPDC056069 TaxID=3345702 RepID=UPI0035DB281A